ncbi:MAG: MerR family transcriptional regulator [Alphaproteobacteria bacterium]
MIEKKYISIDEVSKLLNINKHVIRYWDSKFDGISTRLNNKKQRFFNQENITKIDNLQKTLYQNGKHNYSLDLANKIISKQPKKKLDKKHIGFIDKKNNLRNIDIDHLKDISTKLKNIINL